MSQVGQTPQSNRSIYSSTLAQTIETTAFEAQKNFFKSSPSKCSGASNTRYPNPINQKQIQHNNQAQQNHAAMLRGEKRQKAGVAATSQEKLGTFQVRLASHLIREPIPFGNCEEKTCVSALAALQARERLRRQGHDVNGTHIHIVGDSLNGHVYLVVGPENLNWKSGREMAAKPVGARYVDGLLKTHGAVENQQQDTQTRLDHLTSKKKQLLQNDSNGQLVFHDHRRWLNNMPNAPLMTFRLTDADRSRDTLTDLAMQTEIPFIQSIMRQR